MILDLIYLSRRSSPTLRLLSEPEQDAIMPLPEVST